MDDPIMDPALWLSETPHNGHHASWAPAVVCRWCDGWREYRCTDPGCDRGGPVDPLYAGNDGRLRCWKHHAKVTLWQPGLGL